MLKAIFLRPAAVLLACSVGLCFVPLCHLLAFEFTLVMTVPAYFVGAAMGWKATDECQDHMGQAVIKALLRVLVVAFVPLIPITLNMLRVKNCNYTDGLMFYGLITLVSFLLSGCVGVALGYVVKRRRWMWCILVFVGAIIPPLWRLWFEPPVDAFSLFVAYFPGPIYDEVISVGDRLLVSRVEDAVLVTMFCMIAACKKPTRWRLLGLAMAIICVVTCRIWAIDVGVHRDKDRIVRELGRTEKTAHFVVHGPKAWDEKKWQMLLWDLEFAWTEDAGFFLETPEKPVEVFYYKDATQKKRLLGAGRTQISKPWQGSIHLHGPQVGDSVIIHELAHAFSSLWSEGPIHLPRMWVVMPLMGLVEGLAEGAEWYHGRLDLHQWTAAMQRTKQMPSVSTLMTGAGFYLQNASTSYTRCGSFVRFLRYAEGVETVKALYDKGAEYAERLPQWEAEWNALLNEQVLDEMALESARMRFDRPSLFHKVCAHEIAALRRQRSASGVKKAYHINEAILGFIPGDPDAQMQKVNYLEAMDQRKEALDHAIALGQDKKVGATWRRRGRLKEGDLKALSGDFEAALEAYKTLDLGAFDRNEARSLHIRKAAIERILEGEWVGEWMIELLVNPKRTKNKDDYLALAETLVMWAPENPLTWYLRGKCHQNRKEMKDAVADYVVSLDLGLSDPALKYECFDVLAKDAFTEGRYAEASALYAEMASRDDLMLERGERFELERWSRRAAFFDQMQRASQPEASKVP